MSTWPDIAWLALVALAGAVLLTAFVTGREADVVRRVFFRFFVLIALPLGLILGLMLWGLAQVLEVEERVWQALVAGLFIATGWLTTAIFSELARARDKAERLRDTHKALYAEIGNALAALWSEGESEADGQRIVAAMRDDPAFVPFIPREEHAQLYDAVVEKIEVLPRVTIDAIVAYYSQVKAVAALAEDMRAESFGTLEQPRRIRIYEDYLAMRERAFAYGQYALALIRAYSEGGDAAAKAAAGRLSSLAADRTGRSQGSE